MSLWNVLGLSIGYPIRQYVSSSSTRRHQRYLSYQGSILNIPNLPVLIFLTPAQCLPHRSTTTSRTGGVRLTHPAPPSLSPPKSCSRRRIIAPRITLSSANNTGRFQLPDMAIIKTQLASVLQWRSGSARWKSCVSEWKYWPRIGPTLVIVSESLLMLIQMSLFFRGALYAGQVVREVVEQQVGIIGADGCEGRRICVARSITRGFQHGRGSHDLPEMAWRAVVVLQMGTTRLFPELSSVF